MLCDDRQLSVICRIESQQELLEPVGANYYDTICIQIFDRTLHWSWQSNVHLQVISIIIPRIDMLCYDRQSPLIS